MVHVTYDMILYVCTRYEQHSLTEASYSKHGRTISFYFLVACRGSDDDKSRHAATLPRSLPQSMPRQSMTGRCLPLQGRRVAIGHGVATAGAVVVSMVRAVGLAMAVHDNAMARARQPVHGKLHGNPDDNPHGQPHGNIRGAPSGYKLSLLPYIIADRCTLAPSIEKRSLPIRFVAPK